MADDLVIAFRLQAGGCRLFGSVLYAELMERALEDVVAGGRIAQLLDGIEGDPIRGFLPLRLLGAVHRLVLDGEAPSLARHYPTAGGDADPADAWPHFLRIVELRADTLLERLGEFPQTNEVRRCSGLLGGFLDVAKRSGLPLRLREIGCSAGLNLQWSRYRYQLGEVGRPGSSAWGDPHSPVVLSCAWSGRPLDTDVRVQVESRAGCDLNPPRLEDLEAVRTLESFVWGDQPDRLSLLRAAMATARRDPPRVDRARAIDWLAHELADEGLGSATVVYHSSVWIYIDPREKQAIVRLLARRGEGATERNPLAWLRVEDGVAPGSFEIRLTTWPGGEERLLGFGHPHGREVEWLG